MKRVFLINLIFLFSVVYSQETTSYDPIYIINDEIASKEVVENYIQNGLIKGMQNGITDEKFSFLKDKLGDKITIKEFVIIIEVTDKPQLQKLNTNKKTLVKQEPISNEFILNIDDQAANFVVNMIDGKRIQLSELKGKVVLVNFWATWCAPCIREFYEIPSKILIPFQKSEFVFLAIAIGENKEKISKKMESLKANGIDFNVGMDPDSSIWNQYATGSIPKNFIINKNGVIKYIATGNGENNIETIALEIEKLIKE